MFRSFSRVRHLTRNVRAFQLNVDQHRRLRNVAIFSAGAWASLSAAKFIMIKRMFSSMDRNQNGKVDLEDIAELGSGWQTGYFMDSLLDIAQDWLHGVPD